MQQELEQLVSDMKDSADYTDNEDLQYYAEQLEEIIRKNFQYMTALVAASITIVCFIIGAYLGNYLNNK